jgi:AcrR family transcriptional regulator
MKMIHKARERPAVKTTRAGSHARRKERERLQRCADVLGAARRLFVRHGYEGTTMADIAAASEFAIGTLYQLFPSKEALLRSLLEEQIDELLDRLRQAAMPPDDPRAQIQRIVTTHLAYFRDYPDVLRMILTPWTGSDVTVRRDLGARIDRKHREYLDLLVPIFERGMRDGVFVRRPPLRAAVALTGMINALIRRWLRERDLDVMAEADGVLDLFFHGVERPAVKASR